MASLISLLSFLSASTKISPSANALSDLENIRGTFSAHERMFWSIYSQAGINISIDGSKFTIEESFPLSTLSLQSIERTVAFAQNFSLVNSTFSYSPDAGNLSFLVKPNNISITHSGNSTLFTPQDSSGSSGAIQSYAITITREGNRANGHWENLSEVPQGSPDAINLTIHSEGRTPADYERINMLINRSSFSELSLKHGNIQTALVKFLPPSMLAVEHGENIHLKVEIALSNPVYLEPLINATVKTPYSEKTSPIRIWG